MRWMGRFQSGLLIACIRLLAFDIVNVYSFSFTAKPSQWQ